MERIPKYTHIFQKRHFCRRATVAPIIQKILFQIMYCFDNLNCHNQCIVLSVTSVCNQASSFKNCRFDINRNYLSFDVTVPTRFAHRKQWFSPYLFDIVAQKNDQPSTFNLLYGFKDSNYNYIYNRGNQSLIHQRLLHHLCHNRNLCSLFISFKMAVKKLQKHRTPIFI